MGEELNKKVYYKTENDGEYTELKGVNDISIHPEIDGIHIDSKINKNIKDFGDTLSLSVKLSPDFMKRFMKEFGLNHISKKRAKKLLMSRGWSRNEANKIIEDTIPRTEGNIKNYGVKLRKCNIKI